MEGRSSLAELREFIGMLLAKVAELGSVIAALKAENQALWDEARRLKGLPPRLWQGSAVWWRPPCRR